MNWYKLGLFLLAVGLIITAAGATYYFLNQPITSYSGGLGGWLAADDENIYRAGRRSTAVRIMGVGGLMSILGIGAGLSAKDRPESSNSERS